MNVFATNYDAVRCAKDHCTVHQVKMIVEYAQLLSTAHHELGSDLDLNSIYKSTHVNHPSAKWVRESIGNYYWLHAVAMALCTLYRKRTAKVHATEHVLLNLATSPNGIPMKSMTPFALAMPDKFKDTCALTSYHNYLNSKFKEWQCRDKPIKVRFNLGCEPEWLDTSLTYTD